MGISCDSRVGCYRMFENDGARGKVYLSGWQTSVWISILKSRCHSFRLLQTGIIWLLKGDPHWLPLSSHACQSLSPKEESVPLQWQKERVRQWNQNRWDGAHTYEQLYVLHRGANLLGQGCEYTHSLSFVRPLGLWGCRNMRKPRSRNLWHEFLLIGAYHQARKWAVDWPSFVAYRETQ